MKVLAFIVFAFACLVAYWTYNAPDLSPEQVATREAAQQAKAERTRAATERHRKSMDAFAETKPNASKSEESSTPSIADFGSLLMLFAASIASYFIPTFIARSRHHHNATAIFMLNLFLGWTVIGWVGSLVWSVTAVQPRTT